jgi:hypothetical protein
MLCIRQPTGSKTPDSMGLNMQLEHHYIDFCVVRMTPMQL